MRRRDFLTICSVGVAWPLAGRAQQSAVARSVFQVQGLDHVSLSVADGQRTIDFYRPIFGQEIFLRPNTKAEFRISLGGESYLAINPGRSVQAGTVDHFSIGVTESPDQIRSILTREGLGFTDALYVKGQDGAFVQVSQSADVNPTGSIRLYPRTAAVASLEPVFRPRRLDMVTVTVTSLDTSAGLFRTLCGPESRRTKGKLDFKIGRGTLVVRETQPGAHPGINHFSVLVDRYDHAKAAGRLKTLGTELRKAASGAYLIDSDGIVVYLAEAPL